jgi:hypothetical protein
LTDKPYQIYPGFDYVKDGSLFLRKHRQWS